MKKVLLTILLIVIGVHVHAYDFKVGDLCYNKVRDGLKWYAELTYPGPSYNTEPYEIEHVVVPQSITYDGRTYEVISIKKRTFYKNNTIVSITLPEGLREIGSQAFYMSTLENITLQEGLREIGSQAFYRTKLENITLPESLEHIDDEVFYFCLDLQSVTLPDNVRSLGIMVFGACTSLREVTFGSGLTNIGIYPFACDVEYFQYPRQDGWWYQKWYYPRLDDLYCRSIVPPSVESLANFDPYLVAISRIHVPVGCKEAYSSAQGWKCWAEEWKNSIIDDIQVSSVEEIGINDNSIRIENGRIIGDGIIMVYDLSGRMIVQGTSDQLPQLPSGFYIVRDTNRNTIKIAI